MTNKSADQLLHNLINQLIDALCAPYVATQDTWIKESMKLLAELMECPIDYLLDDMKQLLESDEALCQESTQKYFRLLRIVCGPLDIIFKHEVFRQHEVKEVMCKALNGLRSVFDCLGEIGLKRLQKSFSGLLSLSLGAIEMIQSDVQSMGAIGVLVPLLDSYGLSRFKYQQFAPFAELTCF